MCEYKNYQVYDFDAAQPRRVFTVPLGVTKIKVQAWGGGGRGNYFQSGNAQSGAGGGGSARPTLTFADGANGRVIIYW
jgi:hypothetical protein